MNAVAFEHLLMENSLRQALIKENLKSIIRQVELEQNRIIGLEALVRWQHPEHGLIIAYALYPLAEKWTDCAAGRMGAGTGMPADATLAESGFPPIRMAVNLSPRQFSPHSLIKAVRGRWIDGLDPVAGAGDYRGHDHAIRKKPSR